METRRSRHLELGIVLALVAVVVWLGQPNSDSPVAVVTPSPAEGTTVPSSVVWPGKYSLDGYTLDSQQRGLDLPGPVLEYDQAGLFTIRGQKLSQAGSILFQVGDSRERVKETLGQPTGFSHGGHYWGYWNRKPDPSTGILVKFTAEGVEQISLSREWGHLAVEMASANTQDPVDGSDGYGDLREWAERGR